MFLDEWLTQVVREAVDFAYKYRKGNARVPEEFPMDLSAEEWNEQFRLFQNDKKKVSLPYPFCSQPHICAGKSHCPRDPNCCD